MVGEEVNVTGGVGEGVNGSARVGVVVEASAVTEGGLSVGLAVIDEVAGRVVDMVGCARMGVSVSMVGGREGVMEKGLGATVTVLISWQAESKNPNNVRAAINRFMEPPEVLLFRKPLRWSFS